MTLLDMIEHVKMILTRREERIIKTRWVNGNRNYIIKTNKADYFLKWQEEPFNAAGTIVFKQPGRVGVTANQAAITDFLYEEGFVGKKQVLFQWADSSIHYQTADEFIKTAKPYTQKSGEQVMVTLIVNLLRWDKW